MKKIFVAAAYLAAAIAFVLTVTAIRSAHAAAAANLQPARMAPDFTLRDLQGRTVRLSDFRGKAVVLNFWASWCPPCRLEIPWFVGLQKKYGAQGLQVIGVSLDSSGPAAVAQFARQAGINYIVAPGDDAVITRYGGINVLPTTVYIGRDGKVVDYVSGLITPMQVEHKVKLALATSSR